MEIFENLIPESISDHVEKVLLSYNFPWYLNEYVIDKSLDDGSCFFNDDNIKEPKQFTHIFYSNGTINSDFFDLMVPYIDCLERVKGKEFRNRLIRIKANLLTKQNYPNNCYNTPHLDSVVSPIVSLLCYVNDSDGDTFLFNEKKGSKKITLNRRISPKKGRCLYFNSGCFHASSSPRESDLRVVINFLFNGDMDGRYD